MARIPSGAVASILENEATKNTIFLEGFTRHLEPCLLCCPRYQRVTFESVCKMSSLCKTPVEQRLRDEGMLALCVVLLLFLKKGVSAKTKAQARRGNDTNLTAQ